MHKTFIQRLLEGEVVDVDDEIEAWHSGPDSGVPLWEFLGMTEAEYQTFIEIPDSIPLIIASRRFG